MKEMSRNGKKKKKKKKKENERNANISHFFYSLNQTVSHQGLYL